MLEPEVLAVLCVFPCSTDEGTEAKRQDLRQVTSRDDALSPSISLPSPLSLPIFLPTQPLPLLLLGSFLRVDTDIFLTSFLP